MTIDNIEYHDGVRVIKPAKYVILPRFALFNIVLLTLFPIYREFMGGFIMTLLSSLVFCFIFFFIEIYKKPVNVEYHDGVRVVIQREGFFVQRFIFFHVVLLAFSSSYQCFMIGFFAISLSYIFFLVLLMIATMVAILYPKEMTYIIPPDFIEDTKAYVMNTFNAIRR